MAEFFSQKLSAILGKNITFVKFRKITKNINNPIIKKKQRQLKKKSENLKKNEFITKNFL
jgi:lipopolysaccharide/colanic/teichoic acid biosynthesis glycosyltransferase